MELTDRLYLKRNLNRLEKLEEKAIQTISNFLFLDNAYCSVSWGKDSTVLAYLVASCQWMLNPQIVVPLVHINILPFPSPDSPLVADTFLVKFPCVYESINVTDGGESEEKTRHANLFEPASLKYGPRYLSGVRAEESADRRQRLYTHGETSKNVCTPLLRWTSQDIFAYLQWRDLPIHPNYAMSDGGAFPREHLRVSSLSGTRGNNRDRQVWTNLYYGDIIHGSHHD